MEYIKATRTTMQVSVKIEAVISHATSISFSYLPDYWLFKPISHTSLSLDVGSLPVVWVHHSLMQLLLECTSGCFSGGGCPVGDRWLPFPCCREKVIKVLYFVSDNTNEEELEKIK